MINFGPFVLTIIKNLRALSIKLISVFIPDTSAVYLIMFIIFAISFLELRELYHIIRDHPLLFGIIYSIFTRFSLAAEILSIPNFALLQSFIILY